MRNPARRKQVEKLFVLGAGASLAATAVKSSEGSIQQAPLDAEFAARIADLKLERPGWVADSRKKVVQSFRPNGPFRTYRLEEAILRQLGILELFRSLHARRSRNQIDPHEWLNHLTHLICVVLNRARENRQALYRRLVDLHFPPGTSVQNLNNRVITFNYDTLLDCHLLEHWKTTEVYFDAIRERRDRPARASQDHPLLLKLHGSINWRCASDSLRTMIEGSGNANDEFLVIDPIWMDNSRIPRPIDEIAPLIIPPLPTKPITTVGIFNWLWTRAYEYLYDARELVVIGYSMPPADQLAESMFGSFQSRRMERIVIVDPNTAALDRWRTVLRRTGLKGLRWTYYESLDVFLDAENAV